MGRVGNILEINDVVDGDDKLVELKIDIGGGEIITVPLYSTAGIDSKPCIDDYVVCAETVGDSGQSAVGFLDRQNVSKSKDGEIRLAARAFSGQEVSEIHTKDDGSISLNNYVASIDLDPEGTIEARTGPASIRMDVAGNITIASGLGSIVMTPAGVVSINGKLTIAP